MIIALAGRRVDAKGQNPPRFPSTLEAAEMVRYRIRNKLLNLQATVLVSSAACGADLLAISEAGKLGLRRRIVLPFNRDRFRATSVTDRPGDWGPLYDGELDAVQAHSDLVIAPVAPEKNPCLETNHAIIEEALALARTLRDSVGAVRVWEGESRGEGDLTEEFGAYARKKGLSVFDVMTC